MELVDWRTILAALLGAGVVVAALRVKLSISLDFNEMVEQIIEYRQQARQSRIVNECPHVYPLDVNGFGSRPGFKSAYVLDDVGRFMCSMCGLTGIITEDMVSSIEAIWSQMTWEDWGAKMRRRLKAEGRSVG